MSKTDKKAFYTDRLAAACMLEHHGMNFDSKGRSGIHVVCGYELPVRPGPKYYIHPDSMHMLAPQVDDLVDGLRIGTVYEVNGNDIFVDVHGGDWEMEADRVKIIQRDGKPFFWPEFE